jgi:hypothetical protein
VSAALATWLGVACAVLAALASALGALRQHAGVRTLTGGGPDGERGLRLRGLTTLVRDPAWTGGFALLALGAVLQITALALAPLTVVAPIVALALPAIEVLGARGRAPAPSRLVAVAVTTAGVATFVVAAAGVARPTDPSGPQLLVAGLAVAAAVAAGAAIGGAARGTRRAVAFALAAGTAYGLVAVLVRDVTGVVTAGEPVAAALLPAAGLVLAFAAGSWLVQLGYAAGPADLVVACQTTLNPVVAVLIGAAVLDETTGTPPATTALMLLAAAAAVGGVAALVRGSRTAAGAGLG